MAKSNPTSKYFMYFACMAAISLIFRSLPRCAATVAEKSGDISSQTKEDEGLTILGELEEAAAKAAQAITALQQSPEQEKSLSEESLAKCQKMMDLESGRASMQSLYIKLVLMRPLAAAYRQAYARSQTEENKFKDALGTIYPKFESTSAKADSVLQGSAASYIEGEHDHYELSIKILDLLSELMDIFVDPKTQELFDVAGIQDGSKLLTNAADQCQKTISTILNRKTQQEKNSIMMGRMVMSLLVKVASKAQTVDGRVDATDNDSVAEK